MNSDIPPEDEYFNQIDEVAFYRIMLDQTSDWELFLDDSFKLRYISSACQKITGYRPNEFYANPDLLESIVYKADINKYRQQQIYIKERKTPDFQYDFRITTKTGQIRWINQFGSYITDDNGNYFGVRLSNRDITKQGIFNRNLQHFFNTIQDFLWILDMNGKILEFNQSVSKKLGYKRKELIGQNILMLHPENRRKEAGQILRNMLTGNADFCPVPLITKQGNLIEAETRITLGEWNLEKAIFGVTKDVSELKISETKFSSAFHNSFIISGISKVDNGKYIEVNNEFCRKLGYSRAEVIGKTSIELGITTVAQQSQLVETVGKQGSIRNLKLSLQTKSGKTLEVLFSSNIVELYGQKYFYAHALDITDFTKVQHALVESEKRLEMFFAQSLDGFFFMMLDEPIYWNDQVDKEKVLDYVFEHQKTTKVNKALLLQYGYEENEYLGLTPKDIFKHDIKYGRQVWKDFFDAGKLRIDTDERRKDGTPIWIEGDYICMYDKKGRITGHFGVQRDVTEYKKARELVESQNQQLKEINDAKDKFFSVLSHDLRTPFTAIQGFSELVFELANMRNDAKLLKYSKYILEASNSGNRLLTNLLEWSRIQTNRIAFNPQLLQLDQICYEVAELYQISLQQKQLELKLDCAPIALHGDRHMLQSILRNLISNAIKFTPRFGQIRVNIKKQEDSVVIKVADTGVGMNQEQKDRLFKLSATASRRGTDNEKGSGLGLLLCKEFVNKHKGEIEVESTPGTGTRFKVIIPAI